MDEPAPDGGCACRRAAILKLKYSLLIETRCSCFLLQLCCISLLFIFFFSFPFLSFLLLSLFVFLFIYFYLFICFLKNVTSPFYFRVILEILCYLLVDSLVIVCINATVTALQ